MIIIAIDKIDYSKKALCSMKEAAGKHYPSGRLLRSKAEVR